MGHDLNDLFPRTVFHAPPLGDVSVDLASGALVEWFRRLDCQGDLTDANMLARRLLSENGADADEAPLDPATVDALTGDELDAAAGALIEAGGRVFEPRHIDDPSAPAGARKRTEAEIYPVHPEPGEREVTRLQRLLREAVSDADRRRRISRERIVSQSSIGQILQNLHESPAYRMAQAARGAMLPSILAQRHAFPAPFNPPRATDILAAAERGATWIDTVEAARRSTILTPSKIHDLFRTPGYPNSLGAVAAAADYGRRLAQINDRFALNISSGAFRDLAAFQRFDEQQRWTRETLDSARAFSDYFRPGWQLTASAGLAGLAGAGAVSSALAHYDDEGELAELFAATLDGIREFDVVDDVAEVDLGPTLLRLVELYYALLARTGDFVAREGLVAIFGLLVAVGALVDQHIHAANDDSQRLLAESVVATRASTEEIRRLRADLERQSQENRDRELRGRDVRALTRLRAAPDREATVILDVHPGDYVRVVDVRGHWAEVEVYRYFDGSMVRGWLPRSSLARSSR